MASKADVVPPSVWRGAQDLWLDVFVAFNFLCLTGDIILAHSSNHFRNTAEYVPLCVSPAASVLVLAGLALRVRSRQWTAWKYLGYLAAWLSIAVGVAGVIYHLDSSFFYVRTIKSLTYAAPFVAPLAYVGLGCLLLMNRMVKTHSREWAEWVLFLALGGFAGNFALSLTDHAINGFCRSSEWIPVVSSALAVGFLLTLLLLPGTRAFLCLCAIVLLFQMLVGGLGFMLHVIADRQGPSLSLYQNVISGAPPFAPLLLPNLAILALLGILALDRNQQPSPA
jgi:hypothetical protein